MSIIFVFLSLFRFRFIYYLVEPNPRYQISAFKSSISSHKSQSYFRYQIFYDSYIVNRSQTNKVNDFLHRDTLNLHLRAKDLVSSWISLVDFEFGMQWNLINVDDLINVDFLALFICLGITMTGVKQEIIIPLRPSRSSAKGLVTRRQRELLELMKYTSNIEQVRAKVLELESALKHFKEAHDIYHVQLIDERTIQDSLSI